MNTEIQPLSPSVHHAIPSDARLVELWLHGRPPSTRRSYLDSVSCFRDSTQGKPLREVTLGDLQAHADSLVGLAPATQAKRLAAIKSLLTFASKLGYIAFNVGGALRVPNVKDTLAERILDEDTVSRIVQGEDNPIHRLLLRLFYASGARISEVVCLRWEECHAHQAAGVITLHGKGSKERTVRLPSSVWSDLDALRPEDSSGPVFPSPRCPGRPIDPATAWRWFTASCDRVGVEASPHWFRHAHASHALDRGAPVHLVAATLGHASLATTTRYTHARPSESSGDYLGI